VKPVPKILASDIDGVLTDGTVWIDGNGNEFKRLSFQDIDALFDLHRSGFTLAFLTGEQGDWVEMVKKRLPYKYFYSGCRDKHAALREVLRLENSQSENLCYIGDGLSDVPALHLAGVAVVPANGILEARAEADIVLKASGGQGAIAELARLLKSGKLLRKHR
jgi:YrbI family 3-deoxy-D-manno-octulosonate 8-phosphate phosphatase